MTPKERNALVPLLSVVGSLLVVLSAAILLPPGFKERARIQEMRSRLAADVLEENRAVELLKRVREEDARLRERVAKIRSQVNRSSFEPKGETAISGFVEELQEVMASPGLTVLQVAYRRRERQEGFLVFPFDGQFEATYPAFRRFLQWLESHPTGLRIDELELVSLNNDKRLVQFKIHCSARFRAGA